MESVDRLREHGESVVDYQWFQEFVKLCDAIEAEVAERYVELPRDADGEVIHLGDALEIDRGGSADIGEVTDIHLQEGKCAVSIGFEYDGGVTAYPEDYRHHNRPPTVEGVLDEFASAYDRVGGEHAKYLRLIAEYAAKLRLAEGGEAS